MVEERRRSSSARVVLFVALILLVVTILSAAVGGVVGYAVARGTVAEQRAMAEPILDTTLPPASVATEPSAVDEAPVTPPPTPAPTRTPTESPPAPPVEREGAMSIVEAVEAVQPATVRVLTPGGSGSGFIITRDGYIVTNHHVIASARQIVVDFARGERYPATLIGSAPEFDLAVLKVDAPVPATVAWGDSSAVPLGAEVIAIGSALGQYQNSVTVGILSGVNRELGGIAGLLQTDAAINQGNSGGPLITTYGEVIGINSMIVRGGVASNAEGLGFAIPSNVARAVVAQLIEQGSASRPLIGVSYAMINTQNAAELALPVTEGALIQGIVADGPAEQAGLLPGDIITAIDGRPVDDRETLQMHILSHRPGEQVLLSLLRDGDPLELPLTVGAQA